MTVAGPLGHSPVARLAPLAALTRTGTCVAGALLCVAGGHLGVGGRPDLLVAATVAVALLIAFAQVVNDLVDVEVDRLEKPHRPIVAGAVSPRSATVLAAALLATGLLAAAYAGPRLLAVAAAIAATSWWYSVRLKSTVLVGNLVVALLASAPITFGAAAGGGVTALAVVVQVQVLVFMSAFEVVKTGIDADGDRRAGLRTVATVWGVAVAGRLGAGLAVLYAPAALVPVGVAERSGAYLIVVTAGAIAPTVIAARALAHAGPAPDDLRPGFQWLRWAWFGGVVAPFLLS